MADDKKKPNPTDVHVGSRIRLRRNMMGMSQEKLGESLGITFQQVQKYEKGTNRVGASRLQDIASILTAPVSFFFDDMPGQEHAGGRGFAEDGANASILALCTSQEGLQLNRAFFSIADVKIRRSIVELIKSLAGNEHD